MSDLITFEVHTWEDMLREAETTVPFVVDGMISSASTLIYGEPKAGKSFFISALVAALLRGDREFMGHAITEQEWRVGLCWTDDRAVIEYGQRIGGVLPEDALPDIRWYRLPVMRSIEYWEALYRKTIIEDDRNFIVIDNLSQAMNGSMINDDPVREFFDGVRLFTRAGIPVVIVGHSSEKVGDNGFKVETPMGNTTISASVREKIFYSSNSRRDTVTLKVSGADVEPYTMKLRHGVGARYTPLEEVALRERENKRDTETEEHLAYVLTNCQGMSARQAADKLAAEFGIPVETARHWLKPNGKLGALLTTDGRNYRRRKGG